jgi:hypothetical protein
MRKEVTNMEETITYYNCGCIDDSTRGEFTHCKTAAAIYAAIQSTYPKGVAESPKDRPQEPLLNELLVLAYKYHLESNI